MSLIPFDKLLALGYNSIHALQLLELQAKQFQGVLAMYDFNSSRKFHRVWLDGDYRVLGIMGHDEPDRDTIRNNQSWLTFHCGNCSNMQCAAIIQVQNGRIRFRATFIVTNCEGEKTIANATPFCHEAICNAVEDFVAKQCLLDNNRKTDLDSI